MALTFIETQELVAKARVLAVKVPNAFPTSREARTLRSLRDEHLAIAIECMFNDLARYVDSIIEDRRSSGWDPSNWFNLEPEFHGLSTWMVFISAMLDGAPELGLRRWTQVLESLARFSVLPTRNHPYIPRLVEALEREFPNFEEPDEGFRQATIRVCEALARVHASEEQRAALSLAHLLTSSGSEVEPGEAWSDQVLRELEGAAERERWKPLLAHCRGANGSAPSSRWASKARELVDGVGSQFVVRRLADWLPLVDKPRTAPLVYLRYRPDSGMLLPDINMGVLKGLCWTASSFSDPDLARALGRLAISAYRKVPGVGPRAVKVGNAAVYALGQMPGRDALDQLAMLRVKVKFGTAQKGIEKALTAAAAREGLPRDEIDELGIPSYGLTEVGKRTEPMGDFTAELIITGIGKTELQFIKKDGAPDASADSKPPKVGKTAKRAPRPQKSIPAALKEPFAEELKDLKSAAKDIAAMLPAQRDRIDSLFLENKAWPLPAWRERYLDHPLIGVLARRLIWRVGDGQSSSSVTWLDEAGGLVGVDGAPTAINNAASVRLWHPIEVDQAEVLAWRRFFEDRQIKQPFKQAHREVYLLTDAERTTETYSNRFAAHILRQHQFHALCGVRNWKGRLRLQVDADWPPATRWLPALDFRAEFWVEWAGDDTNEVGVNLYLATDQVRFYRVMPEAAFGTWQADLTVTPAPLDTIPPLVFSEIMRDVDLFVGVASVGNNPQWNDGGPGGAHRDYWQTYSFGDLTQTGAGRRDLLERLVPRLRIAPACSLLGNFLIVKGSLRTYKIHLGSANILMEPNNQYLCIVPGRGDLTPTGDNAVFLPFEGDRTLAIILSKAFMLAADDQITDASITRQIKGR